MSQFLAMVRKYTENSYYNSIESYIFFIFFLSHIPITIFVDFQSLLGSFYPETLKNAVRTLWIEPFGDRLLEISPYWFKSFIFCEIIQLFYFIFIVFQWIRRDWEQCRSLSLIYASHVCTTMVAILGSLFYDDNFYSGSTFKHVSVISVYSIYLLIPLLWLIRNLIGFGGKKNIKNI